MGLSAVQYYVYNEKQLELSVLRELIEKAITETSFLMIQSTSSDWIGIGIGISEDESYSCYSDSEKNLHIIHKISQSTVIGALINDSDELYLALKVKETDQIDFVDVGRIPSERREANFDLWKALLKEGATIEQLAAAFESSPIFVEEALVDVLDLLGIGDASFFNELLTILFEDEDNY